MANKDNNLKLNSSGKGNKKVSPRISPMTLGEFQITPKLSQGARKKGRKSDPTSIEKSTDKENSKKKATFVTVERPNSGASPELTSSSQSRNENLKTKAALTTVAGPNPDVINEKSTDNEKSKKKATFVTVGRPNSEAPLHELTSSSQAKNESPKKKATLITLERTNLEASGRYELTSGSETKSDTKGSLSYRLCFQCFSQFKIDAEMYTYLAAVLKDGECIKTGQASNLENILPKIGSV